MRLGDYLLESSWSSAFQTMPLQIESQPVDILCRGIAFVIMGKSSNRGINNQLFCSVIYVGYQYIKGDKQLDV